jgi:hypothetical protein
MCSTLVVTPRLLGGAVGLRPLGALIAIVVGANWGIWGMLLGSACGDHAEDCAWNGCCTFSTARRTFWRCPNRQLRLRPDGAAPIEPAQESVPAATE